MFTKLATPYRKMEVRRKLLVVGAGLTGSLTAALLQKSSPPVSISVWEKARGAGGRMSTHRHSSNPDLLVDMGAQYISRTSPRQNEDTEFEHLREEAYQDLISAGVLVPFSGKIEGERKEFVKSVTDKYVSAKGVNGIVKHFLNQSGAGISFQHHLKSVEIDPTQGGDAPSPRITCASSQGQESFDCLVLTMPVPQILSLEGNIMKAITPEIQHKLASVQYSSRYALGLFYREHFATNWSAKYFDDPVVRFACWDTAKRGCSDAGSLLLHTSVPFGLKHLEDDKEDIKAVILKRASELIPGLPDPIDSHLIRWRYSQVFQPYPGTPGCVVLSHDPLVVATGDAFSGSNFENCIRAAQVTAKTIITELKF